MNAKALDIAFKFTSLINTDDDIAFKHGLSELGADTDMTKYLTDKRATRMAAESTMTPEQLLESKSTEALRAQRSKELIDLRAKQATEREKYLIASCEKIVNDGATNEAIMEALRDAWQRGINERFDEYGVSLEAAASNHHLRAIAAAARDCYENDDFITVQGEAANKRDQVLGAALSAFDDVEADLVAFKDDLVRKLK